MKPQKIIDLTHALSSDIPSWDGDCCFRATVFFDYQQSTPPNLFRIQKFEGRSGAGTHIDAPAHCFPDARTIDGLELENLLTDCVVIRAQGDADADYLFMPDEVAAFEKQHGMIQPGTFVIFSSGWDKYWSVPKEYRNDLQFPSVHEDTAKLLLERNIAGIGIDTLSPDAGGKDYPVHRVILGAGKYLVENVANAKDVPPTGAKIIIAPMNIKNGTEAPVRLIAVLPEEEVE